jgi:hypothetical protein
LGIYRERSLGKTNEVLRTAGWFGGVKRLSNGIANPPPMLASSVQSEPASEGHPTPAADQTSTAGARSPCNPLNFEKVTYGYLNRVQSSRRLEREAGRNVEVIWLLGRLAPDHKTVADFRRSLD